MDPMTKIVEFVRPCAPYNVGEKAGFSLDYAKHLVETRKVAVFPKGAPTIEQDRETRKAEIIAQLNGRKIGFFKGASLDDLEAKLTDALQREQTEAQAAIDRESQAATDAMVALETTDETRPKFSTLTLPELVTFCQRHNFDVDFTNLPTLAHKQKLVSDAFDVQA